MAEVYRARDPRIGRDVALKVVSETLGADRELIARFEREARLAGSLNHPNVVAVHDVGWHDGAPYFVTELLQGETMRERLTRGRVPLATALDWATQTAEGLAAAHERGIVHRDLKPENLFITRDGHVKLLDFGIAKLAEAARGPAPHPLTDETVSPSGGSTQTGVVFGTPGYMSPEQVRGEVADARTDFFSLGATLYEMLSGQRAFPAGPLAESGYAILHAEPPPLPPEVPAAVAQVVRRCLEKDAGRRFQSGRDLAFALGMLRSPTSESAETRRTRPASGWRRFRVPLLGAVGAAMVLLAYFVGFSARRESQPSVQQVTFRRGSVYTARFAPDGRQVLFSASWAGEPTRIYSTTLDRPDFHPLDIESAELLAISPSGELAVSLHPAWHLFHDGGRGVLARVPASGGAPRELLDGVSYADWAPDGTSLAVVHQVEATSRLEFPIGHVLHESTGWLSHARVSPRGDRVAFVDHPSLYDYPGDLMVVDSAGKKQVLAHSERLAGVAWSSSGDEVCFSQDDFSQDEGGYLSLWSVKLGGGRRLIYRGTTDLVLEDIARDGRALVLSTEQRFEIGLTRTGDHPVAALSWLSESVLDDISMDGSVLLFTEHDRVANLRKTDGTPPVHLADAKALGLSPDARWALAVRAHEKPESRRLLLLPTRAGLGRDIDVAPLEFLRRGRFFPDGRHLAVIARTPESQGYAVYLVDGETGHSRAISPPGLGGYYLEISPDGKLVAALGRDGVLTLYPVDGGPAVALSELGAPWAPAGWAENGTLFIRRLGQLPAQVFRLDLRTRERQLFATVATPESIGVSTINRLKVTPDGRTIGFSYFVATGTVVTLDWHRDHGRPGPNP
jgi:serine/threonine protein kinase/Tol biopolymer transport system component